MRRPILSLLLCAAGAAGQAKDDTARLREREDGTAMTGELKSPGLLSDGAQSIDDEFDKTYSGFLGGVGTGPVSQAITRVIGTESLSVSTS